MNKAILFSLENCVKCNQTKDLLLDRDDVEIITFPHDLNKWSVTMFYIQPEWIKKSFNLNYELIDLSYSGLSDASLKKITLCISKIKSNFKIHDYTISIDAIGVAAVRLDEKGQLQALAAGSLKSFKTGNFEITQDERMDIAFWIDHEGEWQGVIQSNEGIIPPELTNITKKWIRLNIPVPPQ